MLEFVVFVSGGILMGLEILGSRVLAPAFGNSIFVWGSLIGVFLGSLACGYYVGGLLADRRPRHAMLGIMIAAAGLLVLTVPSLTGPVARLADLGPRTGPLLASAALFFLPTTLLGMVSPFAIRLSAAGTERLGRTAGRLYALSTAGSIAGTLGTAFLLVPAFGVADLVRYLGVALLVLGAGLFVRERRWAGAAAVAAVMALVLLLTRVNPLDFELSPSGELLRVIHRQDSLYHYIRVMDGDGKRYLRFDRSWQSGMYLDDPARSVFPYPDYFNLALVLRPGIRDVLFVGLGGGQAPKRFLRDYPGVQVDVVELDPEVVQIARQYFYLSEDPRLRVTVGDGRQYLARSDKRYDLIVLDAYFSDAIPFHLTTREFLILVRNRLTDRGLVAANLIGALEGPKSTLYRSFYRTFAEVFPERYVFPVRWAINRVPERTRNIILFAGNGPALSAGEIASSVELARAQGVGEDVLPLIAELYVAEPDLAGVPVLTDDRAPVENLLRISS